MDKFIDSLVVCARSGHLDHIVVYGYASPDGPFITNDKLAAERCQAIAEYISREAAIPMTSIETCPSGIAWVGLRSLVAEDEHVMSRAAVLRILDRFLPDAATNKSLSDACVKNLKAIDQGRTYHWLVANLFPKLRFSVAVYTGSARTRLADDPRFEAIEFATGDNSRNDSTRIAAENTPGSLTAGDAESSSQGSATGNFEIASCVATSGAEEASAEGPTQGGAQLTPPYKLVNPLNIKPLRRFALKTNLLYDAILLLNLELEWRIKRNWSLALEGGVAYIGKYGHGKAYRLYMLQPEARYWIRPRAPWHGFYIGAFAGGGLYDFERPVKGYRGEGIMGGLSVGFMWPLSRCLSMEAAVGGGYLYTRYKEYKPLDGHHVYQRTKDLNYFGPLKVKLALVWRFNDLNKSGRRALENNGSI
ncbi:MAG: DUF3575 domain-containing protein [Muribaculaceae bacterium]|nr:DUF3575 domain-containing protein [Muribaculaceae bacterium]